MRSNQNCSVWNLLVSSNTPLKALLIKHLIRIFQVLLFFQLVSLISLGLIFLGYLRTKWEGMLNLKILIIFQAVHVPFPMFPRAVYWWWKLLFVCLGGGGRGGVWFFWTCYYFGCVARHFRHDFETFEISSNISVSPIFEWCFFFDRWLCALLGMLIVGISILCVSRRSCIFQTL